jgi:hypothetical protein
MSNTKKEKIKAMAVEMLKNAQPHLEALVEKALNSGAIDTDSWDENSNSMILPKCIVIAVLEEEADQYKAKGTSFEKEVKKEVSNIKCFI